MDFATLLQSVTGLLESAFSFPSSCPLKTKQAAQTTLSLDAEYRNQSVSSNQWAFIRPLAHLRFWKEIMNCFYGNRIVFLANLYKKYSIYVVFLDWLTRWSFLFFMSILEKKIVSVGVGCIRIKFNCKKKIQTCMQENDRLCITKCRYFIYLLQSIINIKISKYFQIPFWKLQLVSRQLFGC